MKRVLIVDDECNARVSVSTLLAMENFYTVVACNGNSAFEKIQEYEEKNKSFDLLITDVVMEGMNGIDLLKKIKKSKIAIKTIVMSAFTEDEAIINFCNAGCYRFIGKPIDKEIFICMIKDLLAEKTTEEIDISISAEFVGLLYNCPFDNRGGLNTCPIKQEFPGYSFKEKIQLMEKMTCAEIKNLIEKHKKCVKERDINE